MDIIKENNEYILFLQTPFKHVDKVISISYDPDKNQLILTGCASTLVDMYYKQAFPNRKMQYKIIEYQSPQGAYSQVTNLPNYIRNIDTTQIKAQVYPNVAVVSFPCLSSDPISILCKHD